MLKILSAEQIKQTDAYTIAHEPITSIALMERASMAFVNWFLKRFDTTKKIAVVCGTGNNGGDGLAIARLLLDYNYKLVVFVVHGSANQSEDFLVNWKRLKEKIEIIEIKENTENTLFADCEIIIDAIFGTGLSRSVEGVFEKVIAQLNQASAIRIAVDVPSGLLTDKPSQGTIVRAHYTVAFQLPKLAFLLPSSFQFVGDWHVVRIGLDKQFISNVPRNYYLIEKRDVCALIKPRNKFDHKGVYGKALLIAGSYGKMGAAILASKAIMRSGAGLLTTHVPRCGYEIMQTAVPESMVSVDSIETHFSELPDLKDFDAIGIGPGLGQHIESANALLQLLKKTTVPVVIDADALNLLASNPNLLAALPKKSILTPHPGEFARLVGQWKNDFERLEKQMEFSQKTDCMLVLKGAYTSISTPEGKVYFNPTGNPGMATAGSGDVLTGIITGFLAQGYTSLEATLTGVYLHGFAGDLAANTIGYQALIASDIVDFIPPAYRELR